MKLERAELYKLSCTRCRSKKIRCNKQAPCCSNCLKKELSCKYPSHFRNVKLKKSRYYGLTSVNSILKEASMDTVNSDSIIENDTISTSCLNQELYNDIFVINYEENFSKFIKLIQSIKLIKFYELFIDFKELIKCFKVELKNIERIGMIYSLLLLRSNDEVFETEIKKLLLVLPDSNFKVSIQLILIEHYYQISKLEDSWKELYNVTRMAYALGIHKNQENIWKSIVFYDTVICFTIARPSSVHRTLFKNKEFHKESIEIIRVTNFEVLDLNDSNIYLSIVDIDRKLDILKKDNEKELLDKYFMLLLFSCSIKLHYPFTSSYPFSKFRIEILFKEFMNYLKFFLINQPTKINFRFEFPFAFCFSLQSFVVLLTCFYKEAFEIKNDMIELFDDCYIILNNSTKIIIDESLTEILDLIKKFLQSRTKALLESNDLYERYIFEDPFSLEALEGILQ